MKFTADRVLVGKGEYKFFVRLDMEDFRYKAMEYGWIGKASKDDFVTSVEGHDGLGLRFKSLSEATKAVIDSIPGKLALDGFGADFTRVLLVEHFDN